MMMNSRTEWLEKKKLEYQGKYDQKMTVIDLFDRLIADSQLADTPELGPALWQRASDAIHVGQFPSR